MKCHTPFIFLKLIRVNEVMIIILVLIFYCYSTNVVVVTLTPQVWWRALLLVMLWRVSEKGRGVLYSVGLPSRDLVLTLATGQVHTTLTNDWCYPYPQGIITLLMMTSTTVYRRCCLSKCMAFPWWGLIYVAFLVSNEKFVVSCHNMRQRRSFSHDVIVDVCVSSKKFTSVINYN